MEVWGLGTWPADETAVKYSALRMLGSFLLSRHVPGNGGSTSVCGPAGERSALPRWANSCLPRRSKTGLLFDDVVSRREQVGRHGQAERLGGLAEIPIAFRGL